MNKPADGFAVAIDVLDRLIDHYTVCAEELRDYGKLDEPAALDEKAWLLSDVRDYLEDMSTLGHSDSDLMKDLRTLDELENYCFVDDTEE